MNTKEALKIAKEINVSTLREDARAILDAEDGNDFIVDFGRIEYRIIHDNSIERIHREEIEELIDDCYGLEKVRNDMGSIGHFLTFDYDGLARDSRIYDGYGHHFASYDGEEIEVGDWHVFRVN